MSFSNTYETLRSGNAYQSHECLEMPAHEDETAVETGLDAIERNDSTNARLSPEILDEKIKTKLEPFHA